MPQNNKSTAKSPFTPKPVVYAAWGLLAAALVAHVVPALETVALVLYAVGLIALCLLALTAPKKGTLAVPRVFLPMLAAAFLIVGCQIGMRPDESPLVWRSILLALILLSLCYRLIPDSVLTASGFPDSRILTPLLLLTPGLVLVWMLGAWGYSYWKTNGEYAGRIIPGIILFLIDLALILAVLPPA